MVIWRDTNGGCSPACNRIDFFAIISDFVRNWFNDSMYNVIVLLSATGWFFFLFNTKRVIYVQNTAVYPKPLSNNGIQFYSKWTISLNYAVKQKNLFNLVEYSRQFNINVEKAIKVIGETFLSPISNLYLCCFLKSAWQKIRYWLFIFFSSSGIIISFLNKSFMSFRRWFMLEMNLND